MVEQADGRFDLQYDRNNGDGGDVWPAGGTARQFHDKTVPDSRYYRDDPSQVAVLNISDADSVMTADFEVQFSALGSKSRASPFWTTSTATGTGYVKRAKRSR